MSQLLPETHPLTTVLSPTHLTTLFQSLQKLSQTHSDTLPSNSPESAKYDPLALFQAYLSGLDLPKLKEENVELRRQYEVLDNIMANIGLKREGLERSKRDVDEETQQEELGQEEAQDAAEPASVTFTLTLTQEQKKPNAAALKTPQIAPQQILSAINDAPASAFTTLPAPKTLKVTLRSTEKRAYINDNATDAALGEVFETWEVQGCGIAEENWPQNLPREANSNIAPQQIQVATADKVLVLVFDYDDAGRRSVREGYYVVWQKGKVKSVERGQ